MNADISFSGSTKTRIVILIGHFGRGGSERQAFLLCRGLRRRYGLDAQVWALGAGDRDCEYIGEFHDAGIPTRILTFQRPESVPFAPAWTFKWAQMLRRISGDLRGGAIDVLLPFTTWPNVVAGLTHRSAGIPLCIWGERSCGGERVPVLENLAVRRYRRFVANSTAGVEFLARAMRVPRGLISFVPNGVEEPNPDGTDWRLRLRLKPNELLVVKIANVTGFKDHLTLLRAWKIVQENWRDDNRPFLALAGTCYFDEVYSECLRTVREARLDSTVEFLESIPNVATLISSSDLGVFSSRNEGMPNGILECMAAGKAVVATDLPGVRDALGANAVNIAPPGNEDALARKILCLLRDKEKRERLGAENRARIQSEFSVDLMIKRHLSVIKDEMLHTPRDRVWRRRRQVAVQER